MLFGKSPLRDRVGQYGICGRDGARDDHCFELQEVEGKEVIVSANEEIFWLALLVSNEW